MKVIIDVSEESYEFVKNLNFVCGVRAYRAIQTDIIHSIKCGEVVIKDADSLNSKVRSLVDKLEDAVDPKKSDFSQGVVYCIQAIKAELLGVDDIDEIYAEIMRNKK